MSGEQIAIKGTSVAGHTSTVVMVYFGLTLNELGIIVGIVTSLAMLALNFYFQWRRDKREERATKELERRKGPDK